MICDYSEDKAHGIPYRSSSVLSGLHQFHPAFIGFIRPSSVLSGFHRVWP
jgi:hypothetical protein